MINYGTSQPHSGSAHNFRTFSKPTKTTKSTRDDELYEYDPLNSFPNHRALTIQMKQNP